MRTKKTKADRIREYLTKNPNADVAKVAARFETAKPVIYKLRKDLQAKLPIELPQEAPVELTWTATGDDQGNIVATLTERGHRYGKFSGHAQVTQELKRVMSRHAAALNKTFTDSQWEALEMIAHKIGRIVNGDPDHVDSWVDIAGYAQLVADELQGVER